MTSNSILAAPFTNNCDEELKEIVHHLKLYEKVVRRYSKKRTGLQTEPPNGKKFLKYGAQIASKIESFVNSGRLENAQRNWFERTSQFIQEISKIEGMGPLRAAELVEAGITTIDDLYTNYDKLSRQQLIGVQHLSDLSQPIPLQEATALVQTVQTLYPYLTVKPTGQVRRLLPQCTQVDCLVTYTQRQNNLIQTIIDRLVEAQLVVDTICMGEGKFTGVVRLAPHLPVRKLCIRTASIEEEACMMLYHTGPDCFVDAVVKKGLERRLSITEHSVRKLLPHGAEGDSVLTTRERTIFDMVGITFVPPEQRK